MGSRDKQGHRDSMASLAGNIDSVRDSVSKTEVVSNEGRASTMTFGFHTCKPLHTFICLTCVCRHTCTQVYMHALLPPKLQLLGHVIHATDTNQTSTIIGVESQHFWFVLFCLFLRWSLSVARASLELSVLSERLLRL